MSEVIRKTDEALQAFLIAARDNEADCVIKYPELMKFLEKMAMAIRDMDGLSAGSPKAGLRPFEAILLVNAYSLYLSAVRIALSGQSPPVFAILRACLESALYAVIVARSEEHRKIWSERKEHIKRCRSLFKKDTAQKYLAKVDPNLARLVSDLYESMIDLGAHPNSRSVFNHLSLDTRDEGEAVTLAILHHVGSDSILQTLAACFETGVCILYLGRHALPDYAPACNAHGVSTILHREFQEYIRPFML